MIFLTLMVRKAGYWRSDGSPALPYWRARDFGLNEEPFSFKSGKWVLHGSRYTFGGEAPKALVVFFHGIGDGRASYIKEIAALAKEGYLVYAYDNTGCMESEGRCIYGLGQTNRDQAAFFKWLEGDAAAKNLNRYAIGHSWGGYGALLALKPSYRIEKCVSIAGFISVSEEFIALSKKKIFKHFRFLMHLALMSQLGRDGDRSVIPVIKSSQAKILYIQGDEDAMVTPEAGYLGLRKAFKDESRIAFMICHGSGHSPYKTPESEKYVNEMLKRGIASPKAEPGLTLDLSKATQHNPKVWDAIFDFFRK